MRLELPVITLDRSSPVGLGVQLADALREAATHGALRPGDRLPSTRDLAVALGVSRTVTQAAYDQLLAEGWVHGRRGSGTYVERVATAPAPPDPPVTTPTRPMALSLRPGAPCADVLDPAAWRRAWRAAADAAPDSWPSAPGDPAFRAAVAEHLLRHRGLPVGADSVIATAGTSSALGEIAAVLPAGARIAVENPGYQRAHGAFREAGTELVPVGVDVEGLVVGEIPAGVDAVYCTPAHQFPLGVRMSATRRVELVERARMDGFWVIEDDYDGELRYDLTPLPLLAALAPDVVAHLGTASKMVSPTLGTGWLVAPAELRDRIVARRELTGARPSRAGQRVLTAMAQSGDLARHLRRLRRELAHRRELIDAAVAAAGLTAVGDRAGGHVVVPLPGAETEARLIAAAADAGLEIGGLAGHELARSGRAGLILGHVGGSRDEFAAALATLAPLLRGSAKLI